MKDGVILFWAAVLPALFPFFFFTRMLTGLGFPETIGKFFEKPVKFLFHTPPISAYIFFMSVLSGYPIGAKLISEFYKNGVINTEESKKLLLFHQLPRRFLSSELWAFSCLITCRTA